MKISFPVIYSITLYISFIIYLLFGIYIIIRNKSKLIYRVFMLCCLSLAIWAFSFSIANSAPNYEISLVWRRIAAFGWGTFFSFFLNFILILNEKSRIFNKKWIYAVIYLPAIINVFVFGIYKDISVTTFDLVYTYSGWINVSKFTIWDWFFNAYFISFSIIAIILMFVWAKSLGDSFKKKEAYLMGVSYAFVFIVGTMTEFIINSFFDFTVPQMAPILIIIPISIMLYCIKCYDFISSDNRSREPEVGQILSESTKHKLYSYLSVSYVFVGIICFAIQYFSSRESFKESITFMFIMMLLGLIIFIVQYIKLNLKYKNFISNILIALSIPILALKYIDVSVYYSWVAPVIFILIGVVFSKKEMLVLVSISTILTMVYIWIKYPETKFVYTNLDQLIKIFVFVSLIIVAFLINRIYSNRLIENEEQVRLQKMMSNISAILITANEKNIVGKITKSINIFSENFPAERIYVVIFPNSENKKNYVFEWYENDLESIKDTLKNMNIQNIESIIDLNIFADQKVICINDASNFEKEFYHKSTVKSLFLSPLLDKHSIVGFMGFETVKEVARCKDYHKDVIRILSHLTSNVWSKIEVEKEVLYRANFDIVTGLPNRNNLNKRLETEINIAKQKEKIIGVIFVDIDSFKTINDSIGHVGGDYLLGDIGNRLKDVFGKIGFVSRFGGDEFVIIIPDIEKAKDIEISAKKILKIFVKPFLYNNQSFFITASVGISSYPIDGAKAEELLKNSDLAMYKSKENGRNRFTVCSKIMKSNAVKNMEIINDLYRALENKEFILHYQPQVNTITGKIVGAEALIRWNHPVRGLLMPGEFIQHAETTGLINNIGWWVLKEACTQNKIWQDKGYDHINMAVNLSLVQFLNPNPELVIQEIINETKLAPEYLELEITESISSYDPDFITDILHNLKKLSVVISIDDFGTEYSSLSRLNNMPIDKIKIDMKFIHGISIEKKDEEIIKVILQIGKVFGLKVIAEGVENEVQLEFLKKNGCNQIQGYYFYKPMKAGELEVILALENEQLEA